MSVTPLEARPGAGRCCGGAPSAARRRAPSASGVPAPWRAAAASTAAPSACLQLQAPRRGARGRLAVAAGLATQPVPVLVAPPAAASSSGPSTSGAQPRSLGSADFDHDSQIVSCCAQHGKAGVHIAQPAFVCLASVRCALAEPVGLRRATWQPAPSPHPCLRRPLLRLVDRSPMRSYRARW